MDWPLVGRGRELRQVGEMLVDGSVGGVVVAGAAGVGKTRLAVEVSRAAESAGCTVEWIRATRSSTAIPLGALAPLLPAPAGAAMGAAELLAGARRELLERAGGRRLVVCVDDGQWLDDASAALVHQVVAAGDAFALVTVRRDERVPDALQALWKDDLCAPLELEALPRGDVGRLLTAVLDAPLDGRSVKALSELTLGNPLFLREVVSHGLDRGSLIKSGGLWRWRGAVAVGTRLADLVAARMDGLDAHARSVLEIVTIGAPLEVRWLEADELAALERLETQGLVEVRSDGSRSVAEVAHPLYGEVIRNRTPKLRAQAIQRRLADAVAASGARRRGDVLRLALWRLDSGSAGASDVFVRAGDQALAALDWPLAIRLAEGALSAGGGFAARLLRGRALAGAGRASEAEELFRALEPQAPGGAERMAVIVARARNLHWGLERPRDAEAVLVRGEQAVSEAGLRDELVAMRAWLQCADGQPLPALASARPLLASAGTREQARLRAAMVVASALAMRGRCEEALAVAEPAAPLARRHRDELPLLEAQLLGARVHALLVAGRLLEATAVLERLYEDQLPDRSHERLAVTTILLGTAWLMRGRATTALRWFRESAALLHDIDTIGFLPSALAGIAQAAAHLGDAELARQAAADLDAARPPGNRLFGFEIQLARAWSAAADGEVSRARSLAAGAADRAQAAHQDGFAVRALHDLCRLGDSTAAAPRLVALAERVDGPFAAIAAAHAVARRDPDGARLRAIAERFADIDALLLAVEAADAAAGAYRQASRHDSARTATQRAAVLLEQCEGARPPSLSGGHLRDALTPREREIAELAARGLSSREIATRLVVSIRTVDNHLQRIYRKLGVTRRTDLHELVPRRQE